MCILLGIYIYGGEYMISKQSFINIINTLIKQNRREEAFTEAMEAFTEENNIYFNISSGYVNDIIEILSEEFDDEYDTISWWMYDAGPLCGDEYYREDCLVYCEGKGYKIKTPADLYDYLILMIEGGDAD